MEKKNKTPLLNMTESMPTKLYAEGDSYRGADGEVAETPRDVTAELKKGTDLLAQGASKESPEDIEEGTRITTGVVNAVLGADAMRKTVARTQNWQAIPGAAEEVFRNLGTLKAENPGVMRRLNLDRTKKLVQRQGRALRMRDLYASRSKQMDDLARQCEDEIAPTLISLYEGCESTIQTHADLQGRMPNLTMLSVGAQQAAAKNRGRNDRLRKDASDEATAAAAAAAESAAAAAPAVPATTTTVSTPTPATPATPARPVVAAGGAAPARTPSGRSNRR